MKTKSAWRSLVTAIALLFVGDVACAASKPGKTVLVFVDLSSSITEEQRDRFLKQYRFLVDSLVDGDTVVVERIVRYPSTQALSSEQILTTKAASLLDNPNRVRQENIVAKIRSVRFFQEMLRQKELATPILEVLAGAPRRFSQFSAQRRIIVLMSDMMESSSQTMDFGSGHPLVTESLLSTLLAKLVKSKMIPDLRDVRIYVSGASDRSASRMALVRGFWQRYFVAAGAEFDPSRYGGDLPAFEGCQMSVQKAECSQFFQQQRDKAVQLP